jgi:uncharacterized membrane protein
LAVTAPAQGMADNVAGMVAYLTCLPALVFLVMKPYNQSPFIRFHSYQSIFLCSAMILVHIALGLVAIVPSLVWPAVPLHVLASAATGFGLIFLAVKAKQGQMYKLPLIGDMAEKQAKAV